METDTLQASRDAHARHAEIVASLEQQQQPSQAQPGGMQTALTSDQQADLAWIAKIEAETKDANGKLLRDNDGGKLRAKCHAARVKVLEGQSIADIRRDTERTLRGEPPARTSEEAPAPPQGSPQERLEQELTERFAAGDYVGPKDYPDNPEVFRELSSGYNIGDLLPDGFGLGDVEAAQLAAAKRAGVSESQVRDIVRMLVQAQQ